MKLRAQDLASSQEEVRATLNSLREELAASQATTTKQKEALRQVSREVERLSAELEESLRDREKLVGELASARGQRGAQIDAQLALGRELKVRAERLRRIVGERGAAASKLASASTEADLMIGVIADYVHDVRAIGKHRADAVDTRPSPEEFLAQHDSAHPADQISRWSNDGALPAELLRPRQKARFSHNYSENLRRLMGYARGMDRPSTDFEAKTPSRRRESRRRMAIDKVS